MNFSFSRAVLLLGLLCGAFGLAAQSNNDCINATVICSDDNIALNPTGPGANDFADPDNFDGCLSGENQSGWYYFEIQPDAPAGLLLGFTINPDAGNGQDYDFALFGPDVPCDELGSPLRCSYAGGGCALCPQTGLGMGATDNSESPAGNGFVAMISVQPGEGYYLLIDNFSNNSTGFSMTWTGPAAPFLNCIDCDAEAGMLTANPNPTCPGSTINFSVSGHNTDADYTQLLLVADENGDFVDIINGESGSLTSAECATFTIYSYNYETGGGSTVPTIGGNISDLDCSIECCDLEELEVSFEDDEDPTFPNAPGDVTLTCADLLTPMADQEWADNCDGNGIVSGTESGSANLCDGGSIVREWEYTDACGNTGTHQQTITVEPTPEADYINPPGDMTVSCSTAPTGAGPTLQYTNNAAGNCEVAGSVIPVQSGSADLCGGTIMYTWEDTDFCGRPINHNQTITVEPAPEAALINAPGDMTISCSDLASFSPTTLNYSNNETGDCLIEGSITPVQGGSADLCGGTITFTWDDTDPCGNPINHVQTITVEPAPEATLMNPPGDMIISCSDLASLSAPTLQYTNNESGDCLIEGSISPVQGGSADLCGGTITFTWDDTDPCGNPINHVQTITVEPAPEATLMNPPGDMTISCSDLASLSASNLDYSNNESGNCLIEGSISPVQGGSADLCGGTITFTWDDTDPCGNPINHVQTITVEPAADADFVNPPSDFTINCTDLATLTAPDLVYTNNESGSCQIMETITPVQGGAADVCGGLITFTWTAQDDCLGPVDYVQSVTVDPAPEAVFIDLPADVMTTCDNVPSGAAAELFYSNDETGSCQIFGSVDPVQDGFIDVCGGDITYTWEYTDPCGRPIDYSQTISVAPVPAATFINPPPAQITVTCDNIPDEGAQELAFDNGETGDCELFGQVEPEVSGFVGICGGTLTYTWDYTDDCGRPLNYSQTITVEPGPAPFFLDPPATEITVTCGELPPSPPDLLIDNGVANQCAVFGSVEPIVFGNPDACGGLITYIWEYTSPCGDFIDYQQNITVEPAPAPAFIDPPADGSVACGSDFQAPPELFYGNGATGDCSIDGSVPATVTVISPNEQQYDWEYTPPCGGEPITHTQVVTQDAAPDLLIEPGQVLICNGSSYDLDSVSVTDQTGDSPTITLHSDSTATAGNEITNSIVTPDTTTVYYVLATNASGCTDLAAFTVRVETPPSAGDNGSGVVCFELSDSIALFPFLTGTPDSDGQWVDTEGNGANLTDPNEVDLSGFTPGMYSFSYVVAGANVCAGDTAVVTLELLPAIAIEVQDILCTSDLLFYDVDLNGNGFIITATGGGTLNDLGGDQYSITGIPIANSVTITATSALDANCENNTTISPPDCNCPNVAPPVSDGSPLVCEGEANPVLSITVTADQTANWYDAATGGTAFLTGSVTYVPDVFLPGLYEYYVESEGLVDGCTSSLRTLVSFEIAENPVGNDAQLTTCDTDQDGLTAFDLTAAEAQISSDPGYAYRYFTDQEAADAGDAPLPTNFTNNTPFSQNLTVEIRNAAGCISYATLNLTVNTPPSFTLDITGESCPGDADGSVVVGADAGAMFSLDSVDWTTDPTFSDLAPGNYTVFVESTETCVASRGFTVAPGLELSLDLFTLQCDPNNTPSNENDDLYTITFNAGNSLDLAGTFTVNDGTSDSNSLTYGTEQSLTFPANGQSFTLTFTDDARGCVLTRPVGPLNSCSSDCLISIDELDFVCNDNETGTDPNDDFYTVAINASAFNGSASGTYFVLVDGVPNTTFVYGQNETFTLPANGESPVISVRDTDEQDCIVGQPIGPLVHCSGNCLIEADFSNLTCNDAGTSTDPNDDTYTFDVLVTGDNVSGGWNSDDGTSGSYGEPVSFGPYSISSGDQTLTFTDTANVACPVTIDVPAPETCSDECALTITAFETNCNDNGTLPIQADDFYEITINATVANGGGTGNFVVLAGGNPAGTFAYGTGGTITLPADGSTPTITVADEGEPTCSQTRMAGPLFPCNVACTIDAQFSNVICNDNGTNDPTDDTFTFDLLVTGENTSTNWTSSLGDETYAYGATTAFGPFPIANGDLAVDFNDALNNSCINQVIVPAPATCSPTCSLEITSLNLVCNDNGTLSQQNDDFYELTVNATAENGGPSGNFTVLVNTVPTGTFVYGEGGTLTLPADGSSPFIEVRDESEANCSASATIGPLAPCTDACAIQTVVTNIVCNDQGTGADSTDDTYTFDVTVNGQNTSGQWRSEDGTLSGNFGETVSAGPFLISEGNQSIIVTDLENPDCLTTFTAIAPEACSFCTQTVNAGAGAVLTCEEPEAQLQGTSSFPGIYEWTVNGTVVSSELSFSTSTPGVYILTATYPDGCMASDSVEISDNADRPAITQVEIIPERCEGENNGRIIIEEITGGTSPYGYTLNGENVNSAGFFTRLGPGDYSIVVTDANGCQTDTLITIEPGPDLKVSEPLFLEIMQGDSGMISISVSVPEDELSTIQWTPPDQLSCDTCLTTGIIAENSQNYILEIIHNNGCTVSTSVQLLAMQTLEIYIPNVFSPNGDGTNDKFTVFAGPRVREIEEMQIFDRWGENVFQASNFPPNDTDAGWDGNLDGQPMNPAVFVYSITVILDNGNREVFKGDFVLKR